MRTRKMARLEPPSSSGQNICSKISDGLEPDINLASQMENEEETKRIMNEVTRNPLVVLEILQNLNFQDLEACRVVNQMWNSLSSSLILKRDLAVVKINFDRTSNNYYCQQQQQQEVEETLEKKTDIDLTPSLKELNNFIKKSSSTFPCTSFHIYGGNLKHVDANNFFKLNGHNVKTLELTNISYYYRGARRKRRRNGEKDYPSLYTTKGVLRKILMNGLPNLKHLSVQNFDFNWTDGDKLELPELESLEWDGAKLTVFKILKGSPNLKRIKAELTFDDIVVITKSKNKAANKAAMLYVLNYKNN